MDNQEITAYLEVCKGFAWRYGRQHDIMVEMRGLVVICSQLFKDFAHRKMAFFGGCDPSLYPNFGLFYSSEC